MLTDPIEIYQASATAFDQGNYPKARLLASQCLAAAPQDSFLHYRALGLKCWAANYLGDNATVEREAEMLLSGDPGAEKRWFEALAWFNLGLVRQRTRHSMQARLYFSLASQRYAAFEMGSSQSRARVLTNQFFAALAHWASTGERMLLDNLAQDLLNQPASDAELASLARAVDLYLRRANGENVTKEAETAARQGVSRAFLAYLLLEPRPLLVQ